MENTIVSISTSLGGAISIVRLSGDKAIFIVNKIFSKDITNVDSHTIHYGYITYNDEIIDEVMVNVLRAPKTYTTEDVVEINCHGGINTTNKVLEILLENEATLAEPGEFTKRAFLNGRIDLTKAEAVNDLIMSQTDSARKMALNAVNGKLYKKINLLRDNLVKIISNIEVNIDYPEYTDEVLVTEDMMEKYLSEMQESLNKIIEESENGRIIKNGINIAIIGKPNVGKSSLLNAFLNEDKAIVTNIAGTTRDIVEGSITLKGILLNFIDTAGIRNTDDIVEKIGVEKSRKLKDSADLVILVLNNNETLSNEDRKLINELITEKSIIFVNKSDLESKIDLENEVVFGNTIEINGIDTLKNKIVEKLNIDNILASDLTYLANTRQVELMKKVIISINNATDALKNNVPVDIIEIDLKNAWKYLGEITGEYYTDELVDNIFKNFCLGK